MSAIRSSSRSDRHAVRTCTKADLLTLTAVTSAYFRRPLSNDHA